MNAPVAAIRAGVVEGRYFYVWMATGFVLVAFGGVVPTYRAPVVTHRVHALSVVHIHGILIFTWTC